MGTNLKSQYYQISFQKMSMNDDNDVTALYLKFIDFIDTFNKTNLSNLDSENDYSFIFMEFKLFNYLCQDIILSDTFKDMNSEVHIQIIHNLNHFNENVNFFALFPKDDKENLNKLYRLCNTLAYSMITIISDYFFEILCLNPIDLKGHIIHKN